MFPFLLNADWELTTSRASVHQESRWNLHLRSVAARLVAEALSHSEVRPHLIAYLPSVTSNLSPFWCSFVAETIDALKELLPALTSLHAEQELVIPSAPMEHSVVLCCDNSDSGGSPHIHPSSLIRSTIPEKQEDYTRICSS